MTAEGVVSIAAVHGKQNSEATGEVGTKTAFGDLPEAVW